MERGTLVTTLSNLTPADFALLVASIDGAPGQISRHGTIPEQAAELVRWADSPTGPGLVRLRDALHDLFPQLQNRSTSPGLWWINGQQSAPQHVRLEAEPPASARSTREITEPSGFAQILDTSSIVRGLVPPGIAPPVESLREVRPHGRKPRAPEVPGVQPTSSTHAHSSQGISHGAGGNEFPAGDTRLPSRSRRFLGDLAKVAAQAVLILSVLAICLVLVASYGMWMLGVRRPGPIGAALHVSGMTVPVIFDLALLAWLSSCGIGLLRQSVDRIDPWLSIYGVGAIAFACLMGFSLYMLLAELVGAGAAREPAPWTFPAKYAAAIAILLVLQAWLHSTIDDEYKSH